MLKASKFLLASALTLSLLPSLAFGQTSDANAPSSLPSQNTYNELYNGTTWDRQRSAVGTTGVAVINTEGTKATFDTSVNPTIAGANLNDVCALPGSATKTIRVLATEVDFLATAAQDITIALSKRSAVNTGTAGTAMTVVPRDSSGAAATAVPIHWPNSAAEIPGAAVGNVGMYFAQANTISSGLPTPTRVTFAASDNSSAIVLRGVAQVLAWNLANIATPAGLGWVCRFTWTEE